MSNFFVIGEAAELRQQIRHLTEDKNKMRLHIQALIQSESEAVTEAGLLRERERILLRVLEEIFLIPASLDFTDDIARLNEIREKTYAALAYAREGKNV